MLKRVPGAEEILNTNNNQRQGGPERGFGSGGDQILINGKRLSGKSNNINDALARIVAKNVSKIELIRGAATGLDVQSQGLVINVLLIGGVSTSSTSWKSTNKYTIGNAIAPEFLLSHSGSKNGIDYMFSFERTKELGGFSNEEIYYDPQDLRTGEEDIDGNFKFSDYKINSNISYDFEDGSELRLNGLFKPGTFKVHEVQIQTGDNPDYLTWNRLNNFKEWEVGGDYNHDFGKFGKLKSLFVINRKDADGGVNRYSGEGEARYEYATEKFKEKQGEDIIRSSLTKSINAKQSIEVGGEAAFNSFDRQFMNFERSAINQPSIIETSDDVKIKENRFEIFANQSYNISPKIVLQSSLTAEFSKITADSIFINGDSNHRDTSFKYLKPRLNLRYDYTKQDQLRLTAEKKVSQLGFYNFVAYFDQSTEEIKLGNTNLRPEQIWEFSLTYEHRFKNDGGSIETEIFYKHYKDYIGRVDFTDYVDYGGNSVSDVAFFALNPNSALRDSIDFNSKPGNTDGANVRGIKIKSNFRLGFIGVPQAVLTLGYIYEKRRSIDQFTKLKRNFPWAPDHTVNLSLRHDITKWQLSYGFEGKYESALNTQDINYIWPRTPKLDYTVFAEYQIIAGIKLYAEVYKNGRGNGSSTYYRYYDHVKFNDLKSRAEKTHHRPLQFKLSLQGSF